MNAEPDGRWQPMWRCSQPGETRRILAPWPPTSHSCPRPAAWASQHQRRKPHPGGRHMCGNWANVGGNGQDLVDGDQEGDATGRPGPDYALSEGLVLWKTGTQLFLGSPA